MILYKLVFSEKNKSFLICQKVGANHKHNIIRFKIDHFGFIEIGIKIKFKFQYLKYRFGAMCPHSKRLVTCFRAHIKTTNESAIRVDEEKYPLKVNFHLFRVHICLKLFFYIIFFIIWVECI